MRRSRPGGVLRPSKRPGGASALSGQDPVWSGPCVVLFPTRGVGGELTKRPMMCRIAGAVKLSERAVRGTARAGGRRAPDLGGFGTPWRVPGPPVVCRTPGCGRSGRNQSDRHDTMCCEPCEMYDGELHSEECDARYGIVPDPDTDPWGPSIPIQMTSLITQTRTQIPTPSATTTTPRSTSTL